MIEKNLWVRLDRVEEECATMTSDAERKTEEQVTRQIDISATVNQSDFSSHTDLSIFPGSHKNIEAAVGWHT